MMPWIFLATALLHSGCRFVNGDQILGADLSGALPVFGAVPHDAVIGYSPAPGSRRIFQLPELKRIGAQYGITVPNDARACFEWKVERITEEGVRKAIAETLNLPDVRIEILAMSNTPAPEGKLVFPQAGLAAATNIDASTPVTWRGYVAYNSARRFSVWARLRMSAVMPRVIAVEDLPAGKAVQPGQVRLEAHDAFPLRNDTARSLEEVIGRMAQITIRSGSSVLRSNLAEPWQVEKGETVEVTVQSGAARIELEAVAETSGKQGDMISLRNPRSEKTFRARVDGKGRAAVMVGPGSLLARAQ